MKKLVYPLVIIVLSAIFTGCFSTEEYFIGAPPNPLDVGTGVELVNDQYEIHSKVFYRSFQEKLGVDASGSLIYEQIKIKQDGSPYIIGSKQASSSSGVERFEFKTDETLSNLSTITALKSIAENLKENYFTGPDDDYIYVENSVVNDSVFTEIYKNGNYLGTILESRSYYYEGLYNGPYQPQWYLGSNDQLYSFHDKIINNIGDGIGEIKKLNSSQISEEWSFDPGTNYTSRFPAVMINEIPYWFKINSATASPIEIYKGNSTIVFQDAQNIRYGYDLVGSSTSNCDCSFYAYRWVSDGINAYILAYGGDEFRLIKFSTQTNNASVVAVFKADFTKNPVPDPDVKVILLKSGTAFVMVRDGNNGPSPADGSHYYEFLKISETESKSYGVISTNDFDSEVTFTFHDFYIVNDQPLAWFSSGSGIDYSDQLLVVTPN